MIALDTIAAIIDPDAVRLVHKLDHPSSRLNAETVARIAAAREKAEKILSLVSQTEHQ